MYYVNEGGLTTVIVLYIVFSEHNCYSIVLIRVGEVKRKVSGTQEKDMSVEVEDINDIEEEK